jgi:hypothetical protein
VRALDPASTHGWRRAPELIDLELGEAPTGATDVDDAVDQPDLMEVDLKRRDAVDSPLCCGEGAKDLPRSLYTREVSVI